MMESFILLFDIMTAPSFASFSMYYEIHLSKLHFEMKYDYIIFKLKRLYCILLCIHICVFKLLVFFVLELFLMKAVLVILCYVCVQF